MKLTNKKGFTLMEMLIVVAIIAILVAIAIPTFTAALEKARVAADKANVRASYAELLVAYMDEGTDAIRDTASCGDIECKLATVATGETTTAGGNTAEEGELYITVVATNLQATKAENQIAEYVDGKFYNADKEEIK